MTPAKAGRRYDQSLLLTIVILLVLGLVMIYSATFQLRSDSAYFLKRQILWLGLGVVAMLIAARVDYRHWRRFALQIMAGSFLSLVAVLFVGSPGTGAQSWFGSGSIQPSELAKLAFIIYSAAWLDSKGEKIRDVSLGLIPFSVLLGVVTGLILLQPDNGTALLIATVAVAMFFVSGAELSQLFLSVVLGGTAVLLVVMRSDYAFQRLVVFFRPDSDPAGAGYQLRGVLSAIQSGGLTGRGLGAGVQKLVPPYLYHTDTILSVIGEELGLIGCLTVVGLFSLVAYRGFVAAFNAPDSFGRLLAFGITCWIAFQAVVHIGGNTRALPFTGITLPFVSYGGSSLTVSLAGMGVLLNISKARVERKVPVAAFAFGWGNRRPRLSRTRRRRGARANTKRS